MEAPDSVSVDLEKDIQVDEHAGSSRSDEGEHICMPSPEIVTPSNDVHGTSVMSTNEPGAGGVLAKVLSRTVSRISIDPGPPPDGGLAAWTQVAMGHLIIFNTWGYIISFGVFQTYYVATLGHSPSDISWVRAFEQFPLPITTC